MSLINDMLRNLEAKRPDDLAKQNLQREIRSLPAAPPARHGLPKLLLLAGLLLALAAVWLQAAGQLLPWLGLPGEPASVAAVLPVAPPVPVASPPASVAVDVQPALIADSLQMAEELTTLPTPAVPMLAVPDPVVPPAEALLKVAASPAKSEPEAPKVAAAVAAGPMKIEKSPVLATPRDRADVDFHRAEAALAAGRGAEAYDALQAALKHDPAHVQARQALLRLLLEQRKFDDAMGVLRDGLDGQPAQSGWAISLARLQLERGDIAAADQTLARSQAYAEGSADYAGFQGHLKSRLGAHRQAAAHYLRATRLAANEGRWWLGLGLALEADGRAGEAKDALRRALATATLSGELTAVAEQHLR